MEATQTSRKRSQYSSSPFGRFTRSKAQLSLHRNRSGQTRSDPVKPEEPYSEQVRFSGTRKRFSEDTFLVCKKTKRDDCELSRTQLTKDLRARRVYSPESSVGAADSEFTDRKVDDLGLGFGSSSGNVTMSTVAEETEGSYERLSCKAEGNTELSDERGKLLEHKQCDGKDGGDCSEKIDALVEGFLTATPDAEICGDSKASEDGGKQEEKVPEDSTFMENAEENAAEKISRNDSVLNRKSVPRSRFPGIVFKAPGSVSYKRLFPFLKDIMGDDSGLPKFGHCQEIDNGTDRQEFQLSLSSLNQEASKYELKTNSCTMRDMDGSNLTSSHNLRESPMQLDAKEMTSDSLTVPSGDDKCLSESKADPTANFHGVKNVGNALYNDNFKQYSICKNGIDCAKATNHSSCTSEQLDLLVEEFLLTTPPDAEIHDNLEVNVDQLGSMPQDVYHVKPKDLTRNAQENAGEGCCLKADKTKSSFKSKSVPRPHLPRKLFKSPGSVSFRRLLPFIMDLTKDDSGTSEYAHQAHRQKDGADMHAEKFQLTSSSQSEEAPVSEHKVDFHSKHGMVEPNALENNVFVNPSVELSHGIEPKLTPFQDLSKLSPHLDTREVVHECLSDLLVNEHTEQILIDSKDECLSESKFDICSVLDDFDCAEIAVNGAGNDGIEQVPTRIFRQNFESPPENMHHTNSDISNLMYEHHSSKEKRFTVDHEEKNQFVNLEKCESVSRCPPQGQNLCQLGPNILDVEDNGTSSHSISRSYDAVVLNQAGISNEKLRVPSENILSEKLYRAAHAGDGAGSVLKGTVYGSKVPSKGNNDKNASCAGESINSSESKTTSVLNRCPRIKLLKHTGSLNYKRLLPFFLNNVKDNSCAAVNNHQTHLLPISASNIRENLISDSNGCVSMEQCTGDYDTPQQAGLHAYGIKNYSSSSRSQIPEFPSSHDSSKVIQLLDEHIVFNGLCKLDESTDPPISVHQIDLPIAPLGPITGVITREEATSALSKSSDYSEVKGNSSFPISSNEEMQPETNGCCQSLSQQKVSEQLQVPAGGSKKGILKRNPRGCRGVCTCLNCVSFRLHAERAFEFSRNQLLDAEEVAQDLMKELSHLRCMLERSTDNVNENCAFDGNQVKEACRKAFATEQLAKDRLSQMNEELNIHCKITGLQPPRVSFAEQVEEKVIQPARQISG